MGFLGGGWRDHRYGLAMDFVDPGKGGGPGRCWEKERIDETENQGSYREWHGSKATMMPLV
ncbi:MAG: hypothetical protein OHK0012_17100 [Synechococcales cyanobacterium]